MKKIIFRGSILALLALGAWQGYKLFQQLPQRQLEVATTKVRRGDVIVRSFTRGELRAVRSTTLYAPNLFGTVQVTRLAALGAFAKEKDLVVEFDDSEVQSRLEEKQLELEQTDEQIKKGEADLAIRTNQDQVDLLSAKYAVRRAELEVKRNELISAIDAKKNLLTLEESKRKLKQLQSDIKSRQEQAQAQIAVLRESKNKGMLELACEKMRLRQVKLLAPMSGLVAIRQNIGGAIRMIGMQLPDIREGDQVQPGMPIADVLDLSELEVVAKVGELDRANLREGQDAFISLDAIPDKQFNGKIKSMSGTASANVFSSDPAKKFDVVFSIDMKQLLTALGARQEQIQRFLATAEQNRKRPPLAPSMASMLLGGTETQAAPTANQTVPSGIANMSAQERRKAIERMVASARSNRGKNSIPGFQQQKGGAPMVCGTQAFSDKELSNAELPPPPEEESQIDVLLRPGLLTDVEIIVEKIPNAIHIPNQAVFEKDGRPIVYVRTGSRFEERVIQPFKRSETTTAVARGLKEGEIIALADPTAKKSEKKKDDKSSTGGSPAGGMAGGGGGK